MGISGFLRIDLRIVPGCLSWLSLNDCGWFWWLCGILWWISEKIVFNDVNTNYGVLTKSCAKIWIENRWRLKLNWELQKSCKSQRGKSCRLWKLKKSAKYSGSKRKWNKSSKETAGKFWILEDGGLSNDAKLGCIFVQKKEIWMESGPRLECHTFAGNALPRMIPYTLFMIYWF